MPIKRFLRCSAGKHFTTPFWIARHTATPPLSLVSQSPPDDDELLSLARRPGSGEKALPSAMQQDGRFLEASRVSTGATRAPTTRPVIIQKKPGRLETKTTPSSLHPRLDPFPSSVRLLAPSLSANPRGNGQKSNNINLFLFSLLWPTKSPFVRR